MNTTKDNIDNFSIRSFLWIMLLSITIIFVAIISSYFRYNKTLKDYAWMNQSKQVMKEITDLKSMTNETESATRGYLLSGRPENIPDLRSNYDLSHAQLLLIRSLVKDNTIQSLRCDTVEKIIKERYHLFQTSIVARNAGNDTVVQKVVLEAQLTMDDFSDVIDRMLDTEYTSETERAETLHTGTKYTPVFLLVASAISAIFIIFAYLTLVKAYQRGLILQNRLSKNVKDLNQSNQELEQYAYIASHDLQEPLRKLRAFSSVLETKEEKNLTDEGKSILKRINLSAARMQTLIDDLLTFSRMVNKPKQADKVDLNGLVNTIIDELNGNDKARNIVIDKGQLPVVLGYTHSLSRLFQNLFSNSIKYAKTEGDIKIAITAVVVQGKVIDSSLATEKEKLFHKITVTDNGIGFEEKYAQRIFNIFQRLHNRNEYSGTGIGLAICKRVVENHDGYISANSQPGVGTSIYVYLPFTGHSF